MCVEQHSQHRTSSHRREPSDVRGSTSTACSTESTVALRGLESSTTSKCKSNSFSHLSVSQLLRSSSIFVIKRGSWPGVAVGRWGSLPAPPGKIRADWGLPCGAERKSAYKPRTRCDTLNRARVQNSTRGRQLLSNAEATVQAHSQAETGPHGKLCAAVESTCSLQGRPSTKGTQDKSHRGEVREAVMKVVKPCPRGSHRERASSASPG